jgi:acylphosphatase
MLHHEVTFSGTVQGVGFRATTQAHARQLGVTGWVRNEPDGTVRASLYTPTQDVLNQLIDSIIDATHGHVTNASIRQLPDADPPPTFEILR